MVKKTVKEFLKTSHFSKNFLSFKTMFLFREKIPDGMGEIDASWLVSTEVQDEINEVDNR